MNTTQKPAPVDRWRMSRNVVRPADVELFDKTLRGFVPPSAFDAHAHLYSMAGIRLAGGPVDPADAVVDIAAYRRHMGAWMGGRCPTGALFFGLPINKVMDIAGENALVAREVKAAPGSRGLMLVRPQDDPDTVQAELAAGSFVGFKVYHVYADRPDTLNATLDDFLSPWMWELADRGSLVIMLHMVRPIALADEGNQRYIREHCLRYPGAKLILAHAARSFNADHALDGIGSLRGLDNVFFDTSAVCEPGAFQAIIRAFGTRRMMYGSDFPIGNFTGHCCSVGETFFWLYDDNVDWVGSTTARPTLAAIDSLLALRQACRLLSLNDSDVEHIFRGNADQILNLTPPADGRGVQALYEKAKARIPGGTQLLSKRPEMFAPNQWPAYFAEARGVEVIDADGRRFIDMTTMGIGACLLGYADPDVNAAVSRRMLLGSNCTLNSAEEVELAELLCELHPWASMARYARTGGEAMAVAVRIARARTRRDVVAVCGYHGWADWYLAANLSQDKALDGHLLPGLAPAGVPAGLTGTTLTFSYNQLDQLAAIVHEHGPRLAAIVMEPTRTFHPQPVFLEGVRELANRSGAALIIDEITAGFRLHTGGAHLRYGVDPDLAVFAKALGNGFPMAAIIGTADVMQAAQESFISSTLWTEGIGPAAALATVRKLVQSRTHEHIERIGQQFRDGLVALAGRHKVPLKISGHPAITMMSFDHPQSAAIQTLWTVRMLRHGFLSGGGFYPCLAHQERHMDDYLAACDEVFIELATAIAQGNVASRIGGPVKHTGFSRLA